MDVRIQKIVDKIESNYNEEISINSWAEKFNLSASRLRHLFKSEAGLSFKTYLRFRRLDQSKKLLETSFLSVKEISQKVGIKDSSHFVRDFEKRFGFSPRKYRINYLHSKSLDVNSKFN